MGPNFLLSNSCLPIVLNFNCLLVVLVNHLGKLAGCFVKYADIKFEQCVRALARNGCPPAVSSSNL
jgi:hypothetical protein